MIGLLSIVAIGFLLGMRHATDPDHVIAVSTIVTREHDVKRSAWIGAAWGVGHTLTILGVGSMIILLRITVSPRVGLSMELAVAVMLIVLGLKNLRGLFGAPAPVAIAGLPEIPQFHGHGDYVHVHRNDQNSAHSHEADENHLAVLDRWCKRFRSYRLVRPLVVGIVHGLAGSAAIALLVLSTIPNLHWAVVYLVVFGIGTVLGMMLITLSLGSTFAFGRRRYAQIGRHFGLVAGLISVAFGVFIAYEIGFVNGLFSNHATWIPR